MGALKDIENAIRRQHTPGMNILRVAAAVVATETVTVGNFVWEVYTGSAAVTAGRLSVDVSAGGTKASRLFTSAGAISDGETVTLGSRVYTFKTALTASGVTAGEVLIGGSAAAALDNLKSAVNGTAGAGTTYGSATVAHADIEATTNTDTTQLFVARVTGTAGNSLAATETCANCSFPSTTLTGGANPTAGEFVDAFVAATNASATCPVTAVKIGTNEVLVYSKRKNQGDACSETLSGSNNAWAAAALFAGSKSGALNGPVPLRRIATAHEVALQTMHFVFGFNPAGAIIQVQNTDGTLKAVDGALSISGPRVTWASSGTTDLDADDIVCVLAW